MCNSLLAPYFNNQANNKTSLFVIKIKFGDYVIITNGGKLTVMKIAKDLKNSKKSLGVGLLSGKLFRNI